MDYRRTYVRDLFSLAPGTETSAYGWVKTRRDSKSVSFVQLSDGSCFDDLQVVINEGTLTEDVQKKLTTGACVRFEGQIVESPAAGQPVELLASGVEVYGEADATTYPLQKKGATMEFLREISHLRARGNTFGAVFRVRAEASFAIHKFFHDRGFHNIHPPIITASDAEGAGAMFHVTTLDPYQAKPRTPDQDFFGKHAFLTVSRQLVA